MLSGQHSPSSAPQQNFDSTVINGNSNDEICLNTIENSKVNISPPSTTAGKISMTKQLTTTSSATISNTNLTPNAISPTTTTSPISVSTSPATAVRSGQGSETGSATLRKAGSAASATTSVQQNPKTAQKSSSNDAGGRSAALERAYVHDVYENCEEPVTGPIRPRVAQFLANLDPGSVVCDVGCGSGRYLTQCNPAICTVGVDRCYRLSRVAREKGGEVTLCDNLELPFRDESFDAVLSLAVVHHFATTERRVSALRELARILRIGGRVVITVWALEQRHRRFESQDVLIPWQPPRNRNFNYSDEEDDDDYLPPYHAYTEDSTNSSRSAGDGDSSSLSSSSPGESCYSFVRRAIQKLAGGRKHPWFLDSWTSKDTRNDSSLDYEDAKDLPIELRRLEDFEDFPDPPLSAGLKSRSLGSILNPPPRQIVRSRSSVPSLGGPLLLHTESNYKTSSQNAQLLSNLDGNGHNTLNAGHSPTNFSGSISANVVGGTTSTSLGRRPKLIKQKQSLCDEDQLPEENPFHMISNYNNNNSVSSSLYTKSGSYYSSFASSQYHNNQHQSPPLKTRQMVQASIFLRKQSSLNEELMAGNRIREKERVRKRIQKQMSLNEAFLCRSAFLSKRLQVIREGFTTKIKSSTGSLERVTKNGLTKIMQNFKTSQTATSTEESMNEGSDQGGVTSATQQNNHCQKHHQHHHHHQHNQQPHPNQNQNSNYQTHLSYLLQKQNSLGGKYTGGPVTYCNSTDCANSACYCSTYHHGCNNCCNSSSSSNSNSIGNSSNTNEGQQETKARRHSRESGSDSSKDSSLQSDTSIESEDSLPSVIFIPKPEQHQQQLNYQQQHQNSNSSSSNSSSSNSGGCQAYSNCCQNKGGNNPQQLTYCKSGCCTQMNGHQQHHHHQHISSVPTSPLIMPCPPTPAHSPAAAQAAVTSPPQTMAAVTAAMAILTPPSSYFSSQFPATVVEKTTTTNNEMDNQKAMNGEVPRNRFNFDEAHIKQQESRDQQQEEKQQQQQAAKSEKEINKSNNQNCKKNMTNATNKEPTREARNKITRQTIKDLPPIPKFRKQQSLQLQRHSCFPIVRRSSATSASALPPNIPKLMSLELFNPATDDLDSDSSDPSSPDSIDSVISAPKSATISTGINDEQNSLHEQEGSDIPNNDDVTFNDNDHIAQLKEFKTHNGDLKINPSAPNDIILNDDSCNILPTHSITTNGNHLASTSTKQQDCAEFAEQLNAQLLREIEDKNNSIECRSLDGIIGGDIGDFLDGGGGGQKRRNGEQRDLSALREELRERRLMLANLSTQPSLQQSPTSSSTSSLSSQTRSFTIHEENEDENDERSYTLQLYENCKISKFNYKRNRHYNLNPETAYLLQDDGDSSIRGDDDEIDDFEHDVILEEDEEAAAAAEQDLENCGSSSQQYADNMSGHSTIKCNSLDENNSKTLQRNAQLQQKQAPQHQPKQQSQSLQTQNRRSTDSWNNSNNSSTTSLDSPSQGGGATTHHRYYHVFREGELDALINHHVTSLHIVSSYYERASWCVVAEKVQVWTI